MTNIAQIIVTAEAEILKKTNELNALKKLHSKYPDLKRYVGRWEKVVYYTTSVNKSVKDYDMRHNCGCCPDSPLEVWPFINTEYGKIYSDPPCFTIGENSYYGDIPHNNWEDKLRKANIPEEIIVRLQAHFEICKASAHEDVENSFNTKDEEEES